MHVESVEHRLPCRKGAEDLALQAFQAPEVRPGEVAVSTGLSVGFAPERVIADLIGQGGFAFARVCRWFEEGPAKNSIHGFPVLGSRAEQDGLMEIGASELGLSQVCTGQVRESQHAEIHVGPGQPRIPQDRSRQVGAHIALSGGRGPGGARATCLVRRPAVAPAGCLRDQPVAQPSVADRDRPLAQIRLEQIRFTEVCIPQAGAPQVGAAKGALPEIGVLKVRGKKIGVVQFSPKQGRALEVGAGKVNAGEVVKGELEPREVPPGQVGPQSTGPAGIEPLVLPANIIQLGLGKNRKVLHLGRLRRHVASGPRVQAAYLLQRD